ncbi:MAG: hypothetical protein JWP88_1916 [Flaviaesturariibacter sp.]|nr:hypothetical protein [Flaviaesturariibacter sp.]
MNQTYSYPAALAAETTAITNLLNDWRTKPELVAAVAMQGAGEWLQALETANTSFQTKDMERTAAEAASTLPYTLEQKRAEAGNLYKELLEKISSFYHINDGAEPWLGLVGVINAHIEKYDNLLAQRADRQAAAKAADRPTA